MYIDWPTRYGVNPPGGRTAALHDQTVNFTAFDHGQFEVIVERGARDQLPISVTHFIRRSGPLFHYSIKRGVCY
jgi:hypothetical protein